MPLSKLERIISVTRVKPELTLYLGLCPAMVIFGFNIFGDAVRDLIDPRLRDGVGRYTVARKGKI